MPGVNDYNGMWLEAALANALATIRSMQTQQQMTLSNLQGQPVLNYGLIPGSNPPAFGLQFVNPNTGGQLMFVGEDGAGNAYQAFYDGNGVLRLKIDTQGFHVYNAAGQEEARLGQLNASPAIYGVGVAPSTGGAPGTLQQVGGAVSTALLFQTGTGAAYAAMPGSSTVTAMIGPSGIALVSGHATIGMGGANQGADVGVAVDNNLAGSTLVAGLNSPDAMTTRTGIAYAITGLSAGSHTFTATYVADGAVSVSTAVNVLMTIQPL